jgi:hypothetical protein
MDAANFIAIEVNGFIARNVQNAAVIQHALTGIGAPRVPLRLRIIGMGKLDRLRAGEVQAIQLHLSGVGLVINQVPVILADRGYKII